MQNVAVNGPRCHSKVSFPIVSKSIWPSRITDVTNRKLYATKYNVEMKLHNVCFYIFNISVHGKEFYFCQDMYFFVSVCSGLETRPRGFPAVGKVIEEQPQLLRPGTTAIVPRPCFPQLLPEITESGRETKTGPLRSHGTPLLSDFGLSTSPGTWSKLC